MSIVQTLLEQVQAEVEKSGHAGRVSSLHLVIGRMSGVHADSIQFAFELLAPDSIAEGATLRIDEPKAECRCNRCGSKRQIDEIVIACPACGSGDLTIGGGQELVLQSIELEE